MSAPSAAAETVATRWALCPACHAVLHHRRLVRTLRVCPDCGRHLPLTAPQRLATLCDEGSVRVIELRLPDADPLEFTDTVGYPERKAAARRKTGLAEAVMCAAGTIQGRAVVVAVMDFRFMGGSLGSAVGEAITQAGELALATRTPLLIVSASGGARMQEGALSLVQMVKTSQTLGQLDASGVLTLSLITDPTFGGVAASYATLTDVIIAEPGARLGFAGPRVIEQTIGMPLPPGFQTAEFLSAHGLVDLVCPRADLRAVLGRLLMAGSPAESDVTEPPAGQQDTAKPGTAIPGTAVAIVTDPDVLPEVEPWRVVQRARDIKRPTALDYIARICTDFQELHGDRLAKDCPAIVGGPARLGRTPVMVIGTQKGHTAAELSTRNFGMASPAGYRKAARLMRLAGKLGIPVVTLIDTPGAHPGLEAEEHGQAFAIAENLRLMAGLPVPTVAMVIGEGGSGGALALAVADRVLMLSNAVYSVISPEGCAAILWHDASAAPRAAAALRIDPRQQLRLGVIDGVVPEPAPGAQDDYFGAAATLRRALSITLSELTAMPAAARTAARHERFRRHGAGQPDESE